MQAMSSRKVRGIRYSCRGCFSPPPTERPPSNWIARTRSVVSVIGSCSPTTTSSTSTEIRSDGCLPAHWRGCDEVARDGWGTRLIRAWNEGWLELPVRIGDRLGESLLGAAPGQVAVADSTTVCFYKLASAALAARPDRTEIITDRDNFPTDRYVLEALAAQHDLTIRWITADPVTGPEPEHVAALLGPTQRSCLFHTLRTDPRSCSTCPRSRGSRMMQARSRCGTSVTAPAYSRWRSTQAESTWPSGAHTSTSTAARAPLPFFTCAPSTKVSCGSRSGAGWEHASRSRWSRATSRPMESPRCSRVHHPCLH